MAVDTETALESYFDFHNDGAIWIRGHRVGIDLLLEAYKTGQTPEQIAEEFDTIRLEDVYATITYYLRHKAQLDAWLVEIDERFNQARNERLRHPSPPAKRLRDTKLPRVVGESLGATGRGMPRPYSGYSNDQPRCGMRCGNASGRTHEDSLLAG